MIDAPGDAPEEEGAETTAGTDDHDARLGALVDEAETLARKDPHFDAEAFAARHPEHTEELRELLPLLIGLRGSGDAAEVERGRTGRFGPFLLERTLGRGGMGTVYLARDERLGRVVALKRLRVDAAEDARFIERFHREARATARLSHENIVQLFDADEVDGAPYYTMRFVDGISLESWLATAERGGKRRRRRSDSSTSGGPSISLDQSPAELDFGQVADFVRQLADAVAHAHDHGILHRDIKPANVMVDRSGKPSILDFGICRLEGDEDMTGGGEFVGTLRYSAPEQLDGAADERSDVYGLGLVLYELLTLRRIWRDKEVTELLSAIRHEEPRRPRKVDSTIPVDLETIARKATTKIGDERYPSAAAMARDLEAFAAGRPITARPPSALYLIQLFAARHRGLCVMALASLVTIAALATLYVLDMRQEERKRRSEIYTARVAAAQAALGEGESASALHHLEAAPPELAGWGWRSLHARADQALTAMDLWPGKTGPIRRLVDSPDGTLLAVASMQGLVVLDAATREEVRRWDASPCRFVSWNASSSALATSPGGGEVQVFDLDEEAAKGPRKLRTRRDDVAAALAWTSLGVVFGTNDGVVWRFDLDGETDEPERLGVVPGFVDWIGQMGDEVVVSSSFGGLWRATDDGRWEPGPQVNTGDAAINVVGQDADAGVLYVGDSTTGVRAVEVATGRTLLNFERPSVGLPLRVSDLGNGTLAACSLRRRRLTILDRRSGALREMLNGHSSPISAVLGTGAEGQLYSGDMAGVVRVWDPVLRGGETVLRGHENDVWSLALSGDGRLLASGGRDGLVIVWDLARGEAWRLFDEPMDAVHALAFAPCGERLWAGSVDGTVYVYDLPSASLVAERRLGRGRVLGVTFAGGNAVVAARAATMVLDEESGAQVATIGPGASHCVPGPGGDPIIVESASGQVTRLVNGTAAALWSTDFEVNPRTALAASPEEGLVAVLEDFERVVTIDMATGERVGTYSLPSSVTGTDTLLKVAFGPDPGHLCATSPDGTLFLWRLDRSEPIQSLAVHEAYATAILADAAGDRLVTGSSDRTVRVWHTASAQELVNRRAAHPVLGDPDLAEAHRARLSMDWKLARILEGIEVEDTRQRRAAKTLLHGLRRTAVRIEPFDARLLALSTIVDSLHGRDGAAEAETRWILERLPEESPFAERLKEVVEDGEGEGE